jgi:hypothetical protein
MRTLSLLGSGLLALAGLAAAAPGAHATLLTTLISGGGTITDGDKVFSNFSCVGTQSTGQSNGCNALDVSALSGSSIGLAFNGGLVANGAGGVQDTVIGYHVAVTDPTQAIAQLSLSFNGAIQNATSLNDASVSITEQAKSGGTIVGQINVSAPVDLQDPPFEGVFDIPLNGRFTSLDVTKDILISTFKDGVSGTISLIEQDFAQTGQQNVVPEPTVLALLGSGLLAIGVLQRRRS